MRLSRTCKLFIKLSVVFIVFTFAIYCIQSSTNAINDVSTYLFFTQNSSQKLDIVASLDISANKFDKLTSNNYNTHNKSSVKQMLNVWSIFTKVTNNSPIHSKFRVFVDSLLKYSTGDVVLHLITDDKSQIIAQRVIQYSFLVNKKNIKVQFYNVKKAVTEIEDIVSVMSPLLGSRPGTYYSDSLFFLSLGLHRIASPDQDFAVMLDADIKIKVDIKEIFKEFDKFGKDALFGLAPELTPVYRHVLYIYRNKNPKTNFGEPSYLGGYSGFNSGVVLFNLKRLRESLEYDQIVSRDSVEHLVDKYYFKGHLGDQDFYTLLGMERPEFIHTIDCGWNRQLCTWWKNRGYGEVFANFSQCDSTTKIWHGNCNTPIPND